MLKKLTVILLLLCAVTSVIGAAQTAELERWWIGKPIEQFVFVDLDAVDPASLNQFSDRYVGKNYVESEMESLKAQLLDTGKFISVEVIPSRGSLGTENLTIYIEFVETKRLSSVAFKGNRSASTAELTKAANLQTGTMFDLPGLNNSVEAIKQLYVTKGFDRVDVIADYVVDTRNNSIQLTFSITEYDWWIGKQIRQFDYQGLQNVKKDVVDDITYSYLGKPFTRQLYAELETELNSLMIFSVFEAEARRGGESGNDLIVSIKFTELPQIETITYEGNLGLKARILEEVVTVKKGDFISWNQMNTTKEALTNLYLERGYTDVAVEPTYTVKEDTNKLALVFVIKEGRQKKVAEIVFEGNTKLSDSVLQKELSLKVQSLFNSGNYTEAKLTRDIQAIQLAYQTRGYVDAKVVNVRTEDVSTAEDVTTKLRIVFEITEQDQWFLGTIGVEGNSIYSDEVIDKLITMKPGSVLDVKKVQDQIGKIADLYWNEGYVENSIELVETRDDDAKTVSYTLMITERAQAFVENVIIRGLVKTKPYVLERELVLSSGDVFSKEKYINSAQNLYNTGLLTNVVPNISYGSEENSLVVTYDVTEGNQMNIGFGVTFGGTVEGFPVSGFLSWSDTNLWGTGRDFSIATELAPDSQNLTLMFSDGWVKDKRWSNSINVSVEHSAFSNGLILAGNSPDTSNRNNLAFPYPYTSYDQWDSAGKPSPTSEYLMPYDYYQVSLGYSTGYTFMFSSGRLSLGVGPTLTLNRAYYDQTNYVPYDYLIYQYGQDWKFSNRLTFSTSWDGRDLINNTTRGYVISQSMVYAGGVLGGLSNYIRTSTSASAFLKIFEIPGEKPTPGVVSFNTTVSFMLDQYSKLNSSGWEWNLSASKYEYLYIDGITIARGVSAEFYKKFLWDNSLEFSIQIAENVLWGEVFVSGTAVSDEIHTISGLGSLDWHFAAGAGIRLKIPGFPLGLYLVKNANLISGKPFTFEGGSIFGDGSSTSGLTLVLAITTSIF